MRFIFASIVLLLSLPHGAEAQSASTGGQNSLVEVTYAVSLPGGGWKFGEAQSRVGIGIEVPLSGRTTAWGAVSRMELNNLATCALECHVVGDPYFLQLGIGYRISEVIPYLTPFFGAGAGLRRWTERGHRWHPSVRAGLDLSLTNLIAARVSAESEWEAPGRVTSGIAVRLP